MQDVNHQLFTESLLDEILLSMRTENKQRAREILKEMDLLSFEDCHPMGLSGGQKQRVAVASAIASERPLICLLYTSTLVPMDDTVMQKHWNWVRTAAVS